MWNKIFTWSIFVMAMIVQVEMAHHTLHRRSPQRGQRPSLHELLQRNRKVVSAKSESDDAQSESNDEDTMNTKPEERGDVVKDYSSPFSHPFSPSYADPNLLASVMNQADEANFRYPASTQESKASVSRLHESKNTVQDPPESLNDVDPYKIFPADFHQFLDLPIHSKVEKQKVSEPVVKEKIETQPKITGGYANTRSNNPSISTSPDNKQVIRPARRRITKLRRRRPQLKKPSMSSTETEPVERPTFPKRLPPVKSSSSTRRRIRPVRFRTKNQIGNTPTKIHIKSAEEDEILHDNKSESENEFIPTKVKATTEATFDYNRDVSPTIKPFIANLDRHKRPPVFPEIKKKFQEDNKLIDSKTRIPEPTKLPNMNVGFKPSLPDPFISNINNPETRQQPVYSPNNFPTQYTPYDPEVLPPITNSFQRPSTHERFQRENPPHYSNYPNFHNSGLDESPSPRSRPEHQQATPYQRDNLQYDPRMRPPPIHAQSQSIHKSNPPFFRNRPQGRPQHYDNQRRRQDIRRHIKKKRPSFLESLGIFRRRRGEAVAVNTRTQRIPSENLRVPPPNIAAPLPPSIGADRKLRLFGPFEAPPPGAPFLHHTTSKKPWPKHIPPYQAHTNKKRVFPSQEKKFPTTNLKITKLPLESKSRINQKIATNKIDKKGPVNYFLPPQPLTQDGPEVSYDDMVSHESKIMANKKALEINEDMYNPTSHMPIYKREVSQKDKERLIAAKFFFPQVQSVRRSASSRHIIPLPVPLVNRKGEHVLEIQPIAIPHWPSRDSSISSSNQKKAFAPSPRQMSSFPPRGPRNKFEYPNPVSFVDPVSSPMSYDGWKNVKSSIPRYPVVGIVKQSFPNLPMKKTSFTPKIDTVDPRTLRRQPRKLDLTHSVAPSR